jgi:hypothetical protein
MPEHFPVQDATFQFTGIRLREDTMKEITVSLLFSACLIIAPVAWGGFTSTGRATGMGNPSCAAVSGGQRCGAVRRSKSVIMVREFHGTT